MTYNFTTYISIAVSVIMVVASNVVLSFSLASELYLTDYPLFMIIVLTSSLCLLFGVAIIAILYSAAYIDNEIAVIKSGTLQLFNTSMAQTEAFSEALSDKGGMDYAVLKESAKVIYTNKLKAIYQ